MKCFHIGDFLFSLCDLSQESLALFDSWTLSPRSYVYKPNGFCQILFGGNITAAWIMITGILFFQSRRLCVLLPPLGWMVGNAKCWTLTPQTGVVGLDVTFLAPTLPTMRINHQQLSQRFRCKMRSHKQSLFHFQTFSRQPMPTQVTSQ